MNEHHQQQAQRVDPQVALAAFDALAHVTIGLVRVRKTNKNTLTVRDFSKNGKPRECALPPNNWIVGPKGKFTIENPTNEAEWREVAESVGWSENAKPWYTCFPFWGVGQTTLSPAKPGEPPVTITTRRQPATPR